MDIDLEQELERLYREQGARLWRSIVLSTGSRDVADDAVAEAFAQAIACGGAIHDPAAWISRAACAWLRRTHPRDPLQHGSKWIRTNDRSPIPPLSISHACS